MLEEIAFNYANQTEHELRAISYGLAILGAVIAGVTTRSKGELRRAPYFAYSGLLVLAGAATQFVWLDSLSAMVGGYLWVLMSVDLLSALVIGYFIGIIAMARSRDAFGHGRYAALAFIPIANLVLLIRRSENELSANHIPTIPLLTGGVGVLTGLVMLIAGVASSALLEQEINRVAEQSEPVSQAAGIDLMIRSKGLEATLREIAANTRTPITVDELTTLAAIEADGHQLRRMYAIDLENASLSDKFRAGIESGICAHPPFEFLLKAGASIHEIYATVDRTPIGEHVVARENCGF